MPTIQTQRGDYKYKIKPLYLGLKKIDRTVSIQNLFDVVSLAEKIGLQLGAIYGTLLGIIREGNLIEHDEDIDLFILEENENELYVLLFELRDIGFNVVRYDRRGLISIMRNGEYIDFYIFRKFKENIRVCAGELILDKFVTETNLIDFFSIKLAIPKQFEDFLLFEYGKNWRTPVCTLNFTRGKIHYYIQYGKEILKTYLPLIFFKKMMRYKEKKGLILFEEKKSRYDAIKWGLHKK